jgi:hypothetical protein
MAIKRMCPNAVHFREFQHDPVTGHRYHGTCGETSLATAMVCATPEIETTQQAIDLMMSMTREMMALGWADKPEGNTTTGHLYVEAAKRGFTVAKPFYRWTDPIPSATLHPLLLQYAGIKPIVLMITHAGEGLIAVDGSHAEAGVNGHFICVVGLADEGYVTMDGDNNRIESELPIYSWAAIEKAHVTGFLMLEPKEGATSVAVPNGWTDKDGVITAPNKIPVVRGIADYIRKNTWDAEDYPLEPEQSVASVELSNPTLGAGVRQIFRKRQMSYTKARGVFETWTGQELLAVEQQLAAAQARIAELTAAQPQPAPATDPAPAPLTNQQQQDLAAMAALRVALSTHA